ncbi:uncharacterized protein B0H18DRAFT_961473 [Fomitopsis serialis]|uniref:uncharacterized protein n=1 Tax=Fomitopsis serialis TaxID=139415 RepID=UPI002008B539|nr:uncharacterized protein B0H18DRAFT_961473 [Neoantrodia serialis]KAH9912010.1 hypothetical protein B0H18DRAFT_961473 [Neoantrodia serialis]
MLTHHHLLYMRSSSFHLANLQDIVISHLTTERAFLLRRRLSRSRVPHGDRERFFEKWLELTKMFGPDVVLDDLTEEQMAKYGVALQKRKKQIHDKLYNGVYAARRDRPKALTLASLLLAAPLPAKRAPQPVEAYSKLYYKTKVKPSLTSETKSTDGLKGQNINLLRCELASALKLESPEVLAEVQSYIEEQKAIIEATKKAVPAPVPSLANCMPEEYHGAIKKMPQVLVVFLKIFAAATGMCVSVYGGGPSPEEGGALQTFDFHVGTTPAGHDFAACFPGLEKVLMVPFGKFLAAKYSLSGSRNAVLPADCVEMTATAPLTEIESASEVVPPPAEVASPAANAPVLPVDIVSPVADITAPAADAVPPAVDVAAAMASPMSALPELDVSALALFSGDASGDVNLAFDPSTTRAENWGKGFMPIAPLLPSMSIPAMDSNTLVDDNNIFSAENIVLYLHAPPIENNVFQEFNPCPPGHSLPTSVDLMDAPPVPFVFPPDPPLTYNGSVPADALMPGLTPLAVTALVASLPAATMSTSAAAMSTSAATSSTTSTPAAAMSTSSMTLPEVTSTSAPISTTISATATSAVPNELPSPPCPPSPSTNAMEDIARGGRPRRERTVPKPADADWQPSSG